MKKSVYDEISEAKENRAARLLDLRAKLAKCKEDKAKAEAEEKAALKAGNVEVYAKAKDAGRKAADKIEFYQIQIDDAESGSLFEAEEKKKKVDAIKTSVEEVKAAKLGEVAQLLATAYTLIEEVRAELNKANSAYADIGSKNKMDLVMIGGLSNTIRNAKGHIELEPYIKK